MGPLVELVGVWVRTISLLIVLGLGGSFVLLGALAVWMLGRRRVALRRREALWARYDVQLEEGDG